MKRLFILIVLMLVILISFSFVLAKLGSVGEEENYFNSELRDDIADSRFLRDSLSLNWDGDASSDYLGSRYSEILIEIDQMEGIRPADEAVELLAEKIESLTGKSVKVVFSDNSVPYQASVNTDDLLEIEEGYRDYHTSSNSAVIYMLYASQDAEEEDILGSTFEEDGIILFKEELVDFTQDNPSLLSLYETSTALHEFGHQLGLNHNEEYGCLMNESADESNVAREIGEEVIVDFCDFEKTLILEKKMNL